MVAISAARRAPVKTPSSLALHPRSLALRVQPLHLLAPSLTGPFARWPLHSLAPSLAAPSLTGPLARWPLRSLPLRSLPLRSLTPRSLAPLLAGPFARWPPQPIPAKTTCDPPPPPTPPPRPPLLEILIPPRSPVNMRLPHPSRVVPTETPVDHVRAVGSLVVAREQRCPAWPPLKRGLVPLRTSLARQGSHRFDSLAVHATVRPTGKRSAA